MSISRAKGLRMCCAWSWFFFTWLYRDAKTTKHAICSTYRQQGFSADNMFCQQQGFSSYFSGMSLNGIQQFQCNANMFLYLNKNLAAGMNYIMLPAKPRIIKYMWLTFFCSIPILPTARQHKRIMYTNCCICRVLPSEDEQ